MPTNHRVAELPTQHQGRGDDGLRPASSYVGFYRDVQQPNYRARKQATADPQRDQDELGAVGHMMRGQRPGTQTQAKQKRRKTKRAAPVSAALTNVVARQQTGADQDTRTQNQRDD